MRFNHHEEGDMEVVICGKDEEGDMEVVICGKAIAQLKVTDKVANAGARDKYYVWL
jgi:hypothetical protein